MTEVNTAVIPAAGLGTRFLPASKAIPKEMFPVVDVPGIQLVIEEAVAAKLDQVVLVNGRHKYAIEEHFDHAVELEQVLERQGKKALLSRCREVAALATVVSVRQKEALGLGHAVACAQAAARGQAVAVLLADDLFDGDGSPGIGQLCDAYRRLGGPGVVGVMEVPEGEQNKYGIVGGDPQSDGSLLVRELVEKPDVHRAPSRLAIIGRYVLPPQIWSALAATRAGHGGEIQLTDAMARLIDDPGIVAIKIRGHRHDAGDKIGYLRANLHYALKRPELRETLLQVLEQLLHEERKTS